MWIHMLKTILIYPIDLAHNNWDFAEKHKENNLLLT